MLIFLSLCAWGFLFWYSHKHPISLPFEERGGGGGGETTVTSHTYYYYKVKAAHNSLDPSKPIYCYDPYGTLIFTIPPYDSHTDYGTGTYSVPGNERNTTVENVSTATYWVFYSDGSLVIDYDNAEFKILKTLIRSQAATVVRATFEYLSIITAFKDVASVIDGRWDTQVQTVFFAEPPTGYNYGIIDLGSIKTIQAIDIVAGFYKPDVYRKYDIDFNVSLQYSLNGTDYYDISDRTHNIHFTGGRSESFEEDDLGIGFQARYVKLILENVKKIEYGSVYVTVSAENRATLIANGTITNSTDNGTVVLMKSGTYVIALTEIAAYDNIVLKSESTLIPLTDLTADLVTPYPSTINVTSTDGFELESAETSATAYILNSDGTSDSFTYTGVTATSFTGVTGISSNHNIGDYVVESIVTDTSVYDYNSLLPKLGDRIYKKTHVDDKLLYTQSQLDYVSKKYLYEFVKNHSKVNVDVLYAPHLQVGDTIKLIDNYGNINTRYFIESIKDNNGSYSLVLARYPE
jgi:hypothetical protein